MKKICIVLIAISLFLLSKKTSGSHILGAEVTYEFIQGNTYEIKISLFTFLLGGDFPVLDSVYVGNSAVSFHRDFYFDFPFEGIKQSVYIETFTFPGAGIYTIGLHMPNRIGNIMNVPNSFYTPFAVVSELIISSSCPNTSVDFPDKPIWYVQKNKPYNQNIAVVNPDHDSLSFELVPCLGEGMQPIPGYFFPPGYYLDAISGELSSPLEPDTTGTFAFAVKITEWKDGVKAGSVIRDYYINIHPDTTTSYYFETPSLAQDTGGNYFISVNPGDPVSLNIHYTDSSTFPGLNVYGEAFSVGNPASVNIASGTSITASAQLSWTPDSTHSRNYPYIFTYRGFNDIQKTDLTVLVYVSGTQPDSCYTSPIGIEEFEGEDAFIVLPNPASNQLEIRSKQWAIDAIEIYNSPGSNIYSSTVHHASCPPTPSGYGGQCIVNCTSFSPGIYFVKVTSGEKIFIEKFIKE